MKIFRWVLAGVLGWLACAGPVAAADADLYVKFSNTSAATWILSRAQDDTPGTPNLGSFAVYKTGSTAKSALADGLINPTGDYDHYDLRGNSAWTVLVTPDTSGKVRFNLLAIDAQGDWIKLKATGNRQKITWELLATATGVSRDAAAQAVRFTNLAGDLQVTRDALKPTR